MNQKNIVNKQKPYKKWSIRKIKNFKALRVRLAN